MAISWHSVGSGKLRFSKHPSKNSSYEGTRSPKPARAKARGSLWLVRRTFVILGLLGWVACSGLCLAQESGDADAAPAVRIPEGSTPESLFADFIHYARMGRFRVSEAYAKALLEHPELDARGLVDIANERKESIQTLMVIIRNSEIGDVAARVLELIEKGEDLRRQDVDRIRANIELLGGDPQQEAMGIRRLAESGEYAIPVIVDVLHDSGKRVLWPRIATALPRIGKSAVRPLVMALRTQDENVRLTLIRALGAIGYPQAIPYLMQVGESTSVSKEVKEAVQQAIAQIEQISGRPAAGTVAGHFFAVAERYYNEEEAIRADPRLAQANVWYWDKDLRVLNRVVVPHEIFGAVMAMRCCQEALRSQPDRADAIALWLAADIRRESRLGLNVRSGDPHETGVSDPTQVDKFPRALYFTQASGARYAHLVLARAVQDTDSAAALGAIEALRVTAGASSLVSFEDEKQSLVEALQFPDLVVRTRAALVLGAALPHSAFPDSEFVVPILANALTLTGDEHVLVVDADPQRLNRLMDDLRSDRRQLIGEVGFLSGLHRARVEFPTLSALFVSSNISEPSLGEALLVFRREFAFGKTPVIVLAEGDVAVIEPEVRRMFSPAEVVNVEIDAGGFNEVLDQVRADSGQSPLDEELSLALALESAEVLRKMAVDGRTVYDLGPAEPALIAALSAQSEDLQKSASAVLALMPTPTAQRAIAFVSLDGGTSDSLRIAAFASLAESAKNHGNFLEKNQVSTLVNSARNEPDLTMRTAASQALGALNLVDNQASEIIRSYYGG